MKENLDEAYSELKRVDHLIHVSLKYTRTVDVLISVLKRFISCIDYTMMSLLLKAKEENKITHIPDTPIEKANEIKKLYDDEIISETIADYKLFRRLIRMKYSSRNEYRRYVTMSVDDNGTLVEIDIDKVSEYFEKIKKYIHHVGSIIHG